MTQPEPYRYIDEDRFCLSARLLPALDAAAATDMLSITVEGDSDPQSAHVPAADVERVIAGIRAAAGHPAPGAQHSLGPADGQQKMRLLAELSTKLTPIVDGTRRDRYAAAIRAESSRVDDIELAAAVMAVADEELRAQAFATARQLGALARELSGVRAELEQARAVALTPSERQFLTFALDEAADEMANGDGFTDEDTAALETFRRLADEAQPEPAVDLPARLEAALTERYTALGNPFSEMRYAEKGPDGWPASHPIGPNHVAEVLRELMADAAPLAGHPQADTTETSR